jgi:hypothetical protein
MARHWFGQGVADWTFTAGPGDEAILAGDVDVTFWSQPSGGAQYTDLLDASANPITQVTSGDGSTLPVGTIPRFQGPDGVTLVWADAGGGARYAMVAVDLGDTVEALMPLVDLAPLSDLVVLMWPYDYDSAAWLPRPDAGDRMVIWKGPSAPPIGGGFMLDGTDIFVDELP